MARNYYYISEYGESDSTAGGLGQEREYMESPMSDGTIEEDFEAALAKEVAVAGQLGSPETPAVRGRQIGGKQTSGPHAAQFSLRPNIKLTEETTLT